ncbi:MAG: hypothetical protein NVSMB9_29370 [Isosphaeraceae bacterium]
MKKKMGPRTILAFAFAALIGCVSADTAGAQAIGQANRIEEDWVLVLDATVSPDGPQLSTVMSPTADLSQPVVVLDINYRHVPTYAAGGLQVLVYNQSGLASSRTLLTNPLNLANETVKWTQKMTLSDGVVEYAITSLNSTTWGTFTSTSVLASFTTPLTSFSTYSPTTSATGSGGAWKTKGLKTLTLVQVRYYTGDTLLSTDRTSRAVDCSQPFAKP